MSVDTAYEQAEQIFNEGRAHFENIKTEEDAKFQLIGRVLVDALGWAFSDISAENKNENGYSDYIVSAEQRPAFVVEAKKIGLINIRTQATRMQNYKISGPALRDASNGISQAAAYASPLGIQLGVLTDGYTWMVFLPYIPDQSYREKAAIVFPGFDAVLEDFATFYELLSKDALTRRTYKIIFDRIHENRLVQSTPLVAPLSNSEIIPEQKTALAFDLEKVFKGFFAELSGDNDPDILINCFVETRESRIADFSLERIASNVLGNLDRAARSVDEGLSSIVESTIHGELGQTIFIVGPTGAGKTTFLDRFFRKTLSSAIRERCVVIYVSARDATGDEGTSLSYLTEAVISKIESDIFKAGFPEWNDLQALYQGEYIKRSKGVDAFLYKRDKDEFKEKFAQFVEQQVQSDRESYLNRLLRDVVNNRKKLPIFVIDNTDEFPLDYKEQIFQFFQSLRNGIRHCLLLFPATDRSAWQFSKTEIFGIYSSRSFFLPTPSPREVFRKRIDYLKVKLSEIEGGSKRAEYFAGKGIKITIGDLSRFAAILEAIFVDEDYASRLLGELSNYNMRKTLELSQRVMTSAVFNIEDIIKSYVTGNVVDPGEDKFVNALLKGDYNHYKQGDEPKIFPIFQVDSFIKQSPLVHLRVLNFLYSSHAAASVDVERYNTVASIYAYFDLISFSEAAVERSITALLEAGLIERYDPSVKEFSVEQRLAITHSGLCHRDLALSNPTFFGEMALTTRTTNGDVSNQIRGAFLSNRSLSARMEEVRSLFSRYLSDEDGRLGAVPSTPEFGSQSSLRADIVTQWNVAPATPQAFSSPTLEAEGVTAEVQTFDHAKGYGFVEVPSLRSQAFLHIRIVEASGFDDVFDGDLIECDLIRNAKGLAVSAIHKLSAPRVQSDIGTVVRLFTERRYGFVRLERGGVDAFFHFHLVPPEQHVSLVDGLRMAVEVMTDSQGRAQVRRVVKFMEQPS